MAKSKKQLPPAKAIQPRRWNALEGIYAFTGWLTTLKEPLVFSSGHDCAPLAKAVAAFAGFHNLPKPREGWEKLNKAMPADLIFLNRQITAGAIVEQMTVPKAVRMVKNIFSDLSPQDQLILFSQIVHSMRGEAADELQAHENNEKAHQNRVQRASKRVRDIERVLDGSYTLIPS